MRYFTLVLAAGLAFSCGKSKEADHDLVPNTHSNPDGLPLTAGQSGPRTVVADANGNVIGVYLGYDMVNREFLDVLPLGGKAVAKVDLNAGWMSNGRSSGVSYSSGEPFYETADCTGKGYIADVDWVWSGDGKYEAKEVSNSLGESYIGYRGGAAWVTDTRSKAVFHSYYGFAHDGSGTYDFACRSIEFDGQGKVVEVLDRLPAYPFALPLQIITL